MDGGQLKLVSGAVAFFSVGMGGWMDGPVSMPSSSLPRVCR